MARFLCVFAWKIRFTRLCTKKSCKPSSLCNLCVLCVSVVDEFRAKTHHRDTENTEVAQRNQCVGTFCAKPHEWALHKKSKASAEGAQYESQGQARAKRSASSLGYIIKFRVALKGRNTGDISAIQAFTSRALSQPRGDALRFARACPWLSYCAPSALSFDF